MKKYSSLPYLVWGALFIVVPLVALFFYSITETVDGHVVFTLNSLKKLFDPIVVKTMWRSFDLAIKATLLCFIIGYPVAMMLTKLKPKNEHLLVVLLVLPMWMNFLLRTYAIQFLLGSNGLINQLMRLLQLPTLNLFYNEGAVLFGMVYNYLPFMIIPIYTAIKKIDGKLIEAAGDLGASERLVFQKVIFPLSVPGVISGITMTFMPAVSTFIISSLLGGSKTDLIGNMIERQFMLLYDWNFGAALSMVLMALILVTMWILNKFDLDSEEVAGW